MPRYSAMRFCSGLKLMKQAVVREVFDKNYIISFITARHDSVVVELEENKIIGIVNWIGVEAVSFM